MSTDPSSLGRCPDCGRALPQSQIVLEYEASNGPIEVFAECPACNRIVQTA